LGLLGQFGGRMLVVVVVSTLIGMAVTVGVLQLFKEKSDA
jgi:putative effector of murein hydrolase LrgA (UPF0299 family)